MFPRRAVLIALLALPLYAKTIRYDIDVHVTPATHTLEVSGSMETSGLRKVLLRSEFSLTASNAQLERGASDGGVTTWNVVGTLPARLRFTALANVDSAYLLHVGEDVAFTTANEKPWYPLFADSSSTGDVRYHVPKGFIVAAPGHQVAPNAFHSDVPLRFWFAAGPYTIIRNGKSAAYLLRERPRADVYLSGIERVINVLSREFGPYRYGRFMLVEVPESAAVASGGFNAFGSAGGIVTRSGALDRPFNLAYYAHEIGHQWWSNLVSLAHGEKRGNYLLDEAMAQFASMRAVEAIEGRAAGERYRRTGYPGFHDDLYCYCAAGYLGMAAADLDRALIELPDDAISDRLSRNKGGLVWWMWADVVGRERFAAILREFTRAHAFGEATLNDLVRAIERGTGRDFGWFVSEWLERTGAPEMMMSWKQAGDDVSITITQTAPFYRMPVDVELRGALASKIARIDVDGSETRADVRVPFKVLDARLDPHGRVVRWTPELRAEAAAAAPYLKSHELLIANKLGEAEELLRKALETLPANDAYAARFLNEFRLADVLAREKKWDEARPHIEAALAAPTRRADILPYAFLRYASIAKVLKDEATARRAITDGLSAAEVAPEPVATDARAALNAFVLP